MTNKEKLVIALVALAAITHFFILAGEVIDSEQCKQDKEFCK